MIGNWKNYRTYIDHDMRDFPYAPEFVPFITADIIPEAFEIEH